MNITPLFDMEAARSIEISHTLRIHSYAWMPNSSHILISAMNGQAHLQHIFAVEVETSQVHNVTPIAGAHATIEQLSMDQPDLVAVGINYLGTRRNELHIVNVRSNQLDRSVEQRDSETTYVLDRQLRPRIASRREREKGGYALFSIDQTNCRFHLRFQEEDKSTTYPVGFTRDGQYFYYVSSAGRDTSALYALDWKSGATSVLAERPNVDLGPILFNPRSFVVDAVGIAHTRLEWIVLSESIGPDLDRIESTLQDEINITSRSLDDRYWIVATSGAQSPPAHYVYERKTGAVTHLFNTMNDLEHRPLAPMRAYTVKTHDGLDLASYLTLPTGPHARKKPGPLVLLVHAGPWIRDRYGFNARHQWLADRGWSVLSVNFRGSSGYGKAFMKAADRQWGGKMHSDLIDAVAWAIEEEIADPDRIAVMGNSYGGYAALAALALAPELFCCGVSLSAPLSLETLVEYALQGDPVSSEEIVGKIGDTRTSEGRQMLRERSPLHLADQIKKPLLIGQGLKDPRVKHGELERFTGQIQASHIPLTGIVYPDEGHLLTDAAYRSFHAIAEAFLSKHLGGRVEPIDHDLRLANVRVVCGAEHICELLRASSEHSDGAFT